MVAEGELAVIEHHAGGGVGGDVIVTSVHCARFVYVRKESLERVLDAVCPAEDADNAFLSERVCLFGQRPAHDLRLPGGRRPGVCVPPVFICGQILVRIEQAPVFQLEYEFAVGRRGRPVHEPRRLIGRIVEEVDTDLPGDHAAESGILVRGYLPGQRDDETKARAFRCVLMGGIDAALPVVEHDQHIPDVRLGVIHVQCEHGTAEDMAVLTPAFLEMSADKSADILDAVLPAFREASVLGYCFGCPDRRTDASDEFFPCQLTVFSISSPSGCCRLRFSSRHLLAVFAEIADNHVAGFGFSYLLRHTREMRQPHTQSSAHFVNQTSPINKPRLRSSGLASSRKRG